MLNEAQAAAVNSNSNRVLCLAGAGTGKTHCMISRISRLVDSGVDPNSILVMTFTNAAAFEMKDRYRRLHRGQATPEFRTFHSFCYSILSTNKYVRTLLGYSKTPAIADQQLYKRIKQEAAMQVGIKLSESKKSGKSKMTLSEKKDYEIVLKAASRMMKQRNVITFNELCRSVCRLFISNHKAIQSYKARFKYIFVDEFQDTDQTQYDFVMSFEDSSIFVVGDALQAIYGFRGADSSIIKAIASDDSWEVIKLHENYRSSVNICDYANRISKYADDSYRVAISSTKEGPDVMICKGSTHRTYKSGYIEEAILDTIAACTKTNTGSSAILARTNAEVETICNYLKSHGIEFSDSKQDDESSHILKSAISDVYMMDWLSTYLTADRYSEYIRLSALHNESSDTPYSASDLIHDFGRVRALEERASKIYAIREACHVRQDLKEIADFIITTLGLTDVPDDVVNNSRSVKELLAAILKFAEDFEKKKLDLYVGTIHSVKGLEYDRVYVLGVDGMSFKLNSEENNNLYYVAVTRARSELMVFMDVCEGGERYDY